MVGALDVGPCPFDASDIRFTLRAVEFSGAASVSADRLAGAWEAARGREVPVTEICRIRDRAAEIMLDEGVLARVEIPPQEIKDGRVRLEVIEAYVAAVRVHGAAGPALRQVRSYMRRLEGRPFALAEVQRRVLLASQIPGLRLNSTVRPSNAGRGAVELDVRVSRDPVDLVGAVQNFGSEAIGPWNGVLRADLNGLTALGERTSLVVSSSDGDEQRVVQLLQEVRLGNAGLVARGSVAWGRSRPGGVLEPLELESDSFVGLAEVEYPFIRQRRHNLRVSAGLEWIDQATTVFGGSAVLTDDRARVVFTRIEGDTQRVWGGHRAYASGGLQLRKGLTALSASQEGDANLSRLEADPQAAVVRGHARLEIAGTARLTFSAAGLTQWAAEPLVAYEALAIGNYTIGRGYDPAVVSGDRGAAVALEVRFGGITLPRRVPASVFGFYDVAQVEALDGGPGSDRTTLTSGGGGVRLGLTERVSLDLTYARPFDPPFAGGRRPDGRLLVNLVARLW